MSAARERHVAALIEAAREIRRVRDAQAAYVRHLQELAAEARRTGKSQTHRIQQQPRAFDYGNGVDALLEALEKLERGRSLTATDKP